MRCGWSEYDHNLVSTEHISAIYRLEPGLISGFIAWDRHHLQTAKGEKNPQFPYEKFTTGRWNDLWNALKAIDCHFVLKVYCRGGTKLWSGDGYPKNSFIDYIQHWLFKRPLWVPGTRWASPGIGNMSGRLWPLDAAKSYGAFVKGFTKMLRDDYDIITYLAPWNEADLLVTTKSVLPGRTHEANKNKPWVVHAVGSERPLFSWSGGNLDIWQDVLKEAYQSDATHVTTGGILQPEWVKRTAKDVTMIDIHKYTPTVNEFIVGATKLVDLWDTHTDAELPIIVTETSVGGYSGGAPYNADARTFMSDVKAAMYDVFGDRCKGITDHYNGHPNTYQSGIGDWWAYN